ncbi:MAG: outer membrane beta-barrel protein [Candidatus Mycalebacterium zealandia]|nr:MAG: outer membrane beta-barrel protein [Candidatus Mycalebacterium zealandia]
MRKLLVLLLILLVAPFVQPASATEGPYIGLDAGLSIAPSVEFNNFNRGIPSRCDLHYSGQNGFLAGVNSDAQETAFRDDAGTPSCTGFTGSRWENEFDSSVGHTIGVTAGYSRILGIPIRAEVEYLYRSNDFDERSETTFMGSKAAEFDPAFGGQVFGRLSDIQSHNVFANLYYDFHTDSKFTPYVGGGVGWSKTKANLLSFFQRNNNGDTPDPTANDGHPTGGPCAAGDDPTANNDCVLEDLEGTVSSSSRTHEDGLLGFQVVLGFDYALSEKLSAGLKLRWAYFSELEGDPETWDVIRDHASTVSPQANPNLGGRSNTVTYTSETDDLQLWGAALSLKYYLN